MLAEDYSNKKYDDIPTSISRGSTISFILSIIKKTSHHFKIALDSPYIIKPLNEDKLTQIFVEQINVQLIKIEATIIAQNQYSDMFCGSKGIPDFYFHELEEDKTSPALFVVESKRLPAPSSIREKEYVIGETLKKNGIKECNGGIERFKIEKHGKGLPECGMLGFIQSNGYDYWKNTINSWIEELSKSDITWNASEVLIEIETEINFSYLNSIAIRTENDVKLHHFWISI